MKLLGVAMVVTGLVAGCSGVGEGPLANDGGTSVCLPVEKGDQDVSFGAIPLRNAGREAATVTGVSVVDAVGLRIGEAVIAQSDAAGNSGVLRAWEKAGAKAAVGYVVPADGVTHNLVLHVIMDTQAEEASLQGVQIDYAVGEQSYRTVHHSKLTLRPECS